MSTLETFVLPVLIEPYKDVTFVVKQSLVDYPISNPHALPGPHHRGQGERPGGPEGGARGRDRAPEAEGHHHLPQTTRTPVFDRRSSTPSASSSRSGRRPVVPIALKTDAWGNGTWVKDYGKVDPAIKAYFEFGKPLRITGRATRSMKDRAVHHGTVEEVGRSSGGK